jgi:hypothetical protein
VGETYTLPDHKNIYAVDFSGENDALRPGNTVSCAKNSKSTSHIAWATRVSWRLKTRFPSMVKQAGYEEIAEKIDQQTIADHLTRLEPEILAKY